MSEEKSPKVSIVCAWYNRADYIKDTVDSLLNQDFDDYEIIIANDGSSDPRVKEILDSYNDPKLIVIHKENEGFTKTIKMLVETAKAPYVAIQGAGEVSYPNRLTEQYEFLSENADYCLVGCSSVSVIKKKGEADVILKNKSTENGDVKIDSQRKGLPFTHGSLMFSKQAYKDCGGYREIFKYAQDYDLFIRISQYGKCFNLDNLLYQRNIFFDGVSTNPEKRFEQAMFVKIANRCHEHKELYGFDPIDRYGDFYFILYCFDMKDTLALYKIVVKAVYLKQYDKSMFFVDTSGNKAQRFFLQLLIRVIKNNKLIRFAFNKSIERLFNNTVFLKSND